MNIFKLTIFMVMLNIVLLFESNICVAGAINDCLKTEIGDKSGLEFYTDRENLLKAERISRSKSLTSKLKPISGRVKSPVEDKIRTLEIDDKKGKKYLKGTTGAVLYTLEDGTQVVFKPINSKWQSNYRAEVLAYEIDRLFGFNLVPETSVRRIKGKLGSVQIYKKRNKLITPRESELDKQSFFDFLIDNGDRNSSNFFVADQGNIVSIDHGTSFTGTGWSYRSFEERHQEIE